MIDNNANQKFLIVELMMIYMIRYKKRAAQEELEDEKRRRKKAREESDDEVDDDDDEEEEETPVAWKVISPLLFPFKLSGTVLTIPFSFWRSAQANAFQMKPLDLALCIYICQLAQHQKTCTPI